MAALAAAAMRPVMRHTDGWAAPKKSSSSTRACGFLWNARKVPTPYAVAATHHYHVYIQHNLTRSPQKPIIPQLHDHGHLAVELDALEGHARAMPLQSVVAPPGCGLFQSVGDRRAVVLVLQLFC